MICGDVFSVHSLPLFPLLLSVCCVSCSGAWHVLRAAFEGQPNIIDLLVNHCNGSLNDVDNVVEFAHVLLIFLYGWGLTECPSLMLSIASTLATSVFDSTRQTKCMCGDQCMPQPPVHGSQPPQSEGYQHTWLHCIHAIQPPHDLITMWPHGHSSHRCIALFHGLAPWCMQSCSSVVRVIDWQCSSAYPVHVHMFTCVSHACHFLRKTYSQSV